jgi:hypothetical protein
MLLSHVRNFYLGFWRFSKQNFLFTLPRPPLSARFPRKKSIPLKREMLEQNRYQKRNKEKLHRRRIKKCKNYIYNSMRSVV